MVNRNQFHHNQQQELKCGEMKLQSGGSTFPTIPHLILAAGNLKKKRNVKCKRNEIRNVTRAANNCASSSNVTASLPKSGAVSHSPLPAPRQSPTSPRRNRHFPPNSPAPRRRDFVRWPSYRLHFGRDALRPHRASFHPCRASLHSPSDRFHTQREGLRPHRDRPCPDRESLCPHRERLCPRN